MKINQNFKAVANELFVNSEVIQSKKNQNWLLMIGPFFHWYGI